MQTYTLLDIDKSGNINPKKQITKEEFLRMSYIVLKSNSCVDVSENEIAMTTSIYDKSCSLLESGCSFSDLNDAANTYDFSAKAEGFCSD